MSRMSMDIAQQYIDGRWLPGLAERAAVGESVDPATGRIAGRYYDATPGDAEAALTAARRAFEQDSWPRQPRLRADVLRRFADRLEQRQEEIADVLVKLNGKLRREALGEIRAGVSELHYYAGLARNLFGRTIEIEPGCYSWLDREAIGVAVIIVPWNAPVTLLVRSLAPALAAGCSVVIKAAHQTAMVHQMVMECLLADDRLPAGIVNSLVGARSDTSEHLCASPETDVISFTGSTRVGKRIAQAASANLTRLSLELGGKAPAVVLADTDTTAAVRGIVAHSLVMAGQMCSAIARVLVEAPVHQEFTRQLKQAFDAVRVGPGESADSDMGPLIDAANRDRVLKLARDAGDVARVIRAGGVPDGTPPGSAFLTPTLVAVDDLESPYIQEELFGPLLVIESFEGDADALRRANATRFGLAASLWGRDDARMRRLARGIKSGSVWFNTHNKLHAEAETGGYRESGYGRLHGVEGLNDFLETKHTYWETR
ncbi:MAG: aldehyde dehydrogenase family protein [Pigmentiphaga sp.]|nr:aldehyde dehydrogenase family protein [Pigmentiphaga sp.]